MNKRNKIIVSIVGITIVLLALLGITYAYYLTRIEGNTNTNSISITTADLTLKYDDGTSYINLTNIMPGVTTDGLGDNPKPKVFTVTNDGSGDVEYSVGMDEITNTLTRTQDLTYSITCQEKLIEASDSSYTPCATTPSNSGEYPKTNSYLFTNQIKQDYIQKYSVVISYANPDEDQSADMGSTIKGRMQIYSVPETIDIKGTITGASIGDYVQINSNPKTSVIAEDGTYKLIGVEPGTHTLKVMNGSTTKGTKEIVVKQGTSSSIFDNVITFTKYDRVATINVTSVSTNLGVNISAIVDDRTSLRDAIIDNARQASSEGSATRTLYSPNPITVPAQEISEENERTLSIAPDNYGDSYYFRGNVEDNYVNFSNKCWRIVRIQGDWSIKLTLESQSKCSDNMTNDFYIQNYQINWGYKFENDNWLADYNSGTTGMKKELINWLKSIDGNADKLLKIDEWCLGNEINTYNFDTPYELLGTSANQNYDSDRKFYYETGRNLGGKGVTSNATFICDGETDLSKIGVLTADEVVFAGGKVDEESKEYYLKKTNFNWWTLSRAYFDVDRLDSYDYLFLVNSFGAVNADGVLGAYYVRPAVTLVSGIKIKSGDGTINNPYVIDER